MNEKLTQRIKEFADLRWPDRDLPGRLRKMGEEVGELNEAAAYLFSAVHVAAMATQHTGEENAELDDQIYGLLANLASEVADVAILLQDILIVSGCEGSLAEYMDAKMEVNERREWPVEEVQQGPL